MNTGTSDWYALDVHRRIELEELAQLSDVSVAELEELVASGALVPVVGEAGSGHQFSAGCVGPLREAMRLRAEQHLDLPTVSLLLGYLLRIAHLEHQLRTLHSQPQHPQHLPREGPTPWREPHA
jgi:hypothetical protein